ncbi:MAG: hypothetical protein LC789_06900 [Actinobacteria bacterium]|nr:hypothetical protein [Actinomycetota bacterium]
MTIADRSDLRAVSVRTDTERLIDQLSGIAGWNQTRREVELWATESNSREMRMDRSRRLDVIRRQHRALVEATDRQLRDSGDLLRSSAAPRAVVVHRNDWFKGKVGNDLRASGICIVGELSNGADAIGRVVAEQPDLLLVEDKLPLVGGAEVVRDVRRYAPGTLIVVQVENDDDIGQFLEAGARAAFSRRVPPADVAARICELLIG